MPAVVLLLAAGALLLFSPAPVAAQSIEPAFAVPMNMAAAPGMVESGDAGKQDEPGSALGDYGRWIKRAEKMALTELDFWGASQTMPEGFLVPMFGYGTMRAAQRFDNNRHLIDIIPVFHVPDPFRLYNGEHFFDFNFNARGTTRGYLFALIYGISDHVMIGVNTLFADINISMNPILLPGSCERMGVATLNDFYKLLVQLGRPVPKLSYKSNPLDMGDTAIFVTWNYLRQEYVAAAITPKLYLPTAHRAAPNDNIIFALGPDLDTGSSAWGAGLNPVLDFRLPAPAKLVSFSFSGEGAVFGQTERTSPKFLKPNQDVIDYLTSQKVQLDLFPDLSDMKPHYYYTPPPWIAASATMGIGPASFGYRHGWGFMGNFQTNSPGFVKLIKVIGLVGNGDDGRIFGQVSVPLTPLYIPGLAVFHAEYLTDGRNTMVFRDIYQMGVGFLIPIAPPPKYRLLDRNPPTGPSQPQQPAAPPAVSPQPTTTPGAAAPAAPPAVSPSPAPQPSAPAPAPPPAPPKQQGGI
jgi:hypothetical protein